MPLRSVIQSFLCHVRNLELKSKEGEDLFEKEFQELKVLSDEFRASSQCTCSVGEQDVNRRKNRYKDILPYNNNRVVLTEIPGVPGSDYINASFIKGATGSQSYIASQAPLPCTVEDFWRMIWECNIRIIIMASNEIEGGRHKCERYWPNEEEIKKFGDISVSLAEQRVICSDYNAKKLKVEHKGDTRIIHHFHYHTWPDHGVPLSVKAILDMVMLVREFQTGELLPVLIHCSAGCGRTGTICAIDYVCGLLRTGKLNEGFNLKQLVFEMRKQRIAMVQTKEQYILLHKAVQELFNDHIKVIDSHPYENIDFSGRPKPLKEEPDYVNITADVLQQNGVSHKNSDCRVSKNLDEQGQQNLSISNVENAQHQDQRSSVERSILDAAPPLPIKTKVGHTFRDANLGDHTLSSSREASPSTSQRSTSHSPASLSNKSKMEYVNDWCDGIAVSKQDGLESAQRSEHYRISDSKALPPSSSCTPSTQSPSPSPNSKRSRTPENGHKPVTDKPRISNLVRKPSIAKLKALFESDGNSDSSGPPSPESGAMDSSRSKLKKGYAKSDTAVAEQRYSKEMDSLVVPARAKHKLKNRPVYVDNAEYKALTARYEDISFRLFKESRHSGSEESDSQITKMLNSSPSPSIWSVSSAINIPGSQEESSKSISENLDSSPQNQQHLSYVSSHTSSPSAPSDEGLNLSSENVTQQAKEFVGRLVGSRRNSFAEKRSSTWYDTEISPEIISVTSDAVAQQNNHLQNKIALFFSGSMEKKSKLVEDKKTAAAVKRSISMKVGFRSPLIRRKHNARENVAAYLAVEDNSKASAKDGNASGLKKPFRRLQGYANVKPMQNPTFYHLSGAPVELTKFTLQDDRVQKKYSQDKKECRAFRQPVRVLCHDSSENRSCSYMNHNNSPLASPVIFRKTNRAQREGSPIQIRESNSSCESRNQSPCAGFVEETKSEGTIRDLNTDESLAHGSSIKAETCQNVSSNVENGNVKGCQHEGEITSSETSNPAEFEGLATADVSCKLLPLVGAYDGGLMSKSLTEDILVRDNSYGADMDEYCQKIIHDCQEYLVNHHHYSNLTPEAQCNIRWIEKTLNQSPRRAIVDVTSSSTENLISLDSNTVKMSQTDASLHDYERLWFSRSGQDVSPSSSTCAKGDKEDTSVQEVTLEFPPRDEDFDDQTTVHHSQKPDEFSSKYTNETTGRQVPIPATRMLKDAKFSKAVNELKNLIDELEVDLPDRPRKPQPAPRTILTTSPKGDITFSKATGIKDNRNATSQGMLDCADRCSESSHVYECISQMQAPERVSKARADYAYTPKVENLTPLRTATNTMKDKDKGNHEYEEIVFVDCDSEWSKHHIYEQLSVDRSLHKDECYLKANRDRSCSRSSITDGSLVKVQNCRDEQDKARLYGRVNKPKRKKHNLKADKHNASSVNSADLYMDENQWQQQSANFESLSAVSEWREYNEDYLKPIAPPRLRRNPSSSSTGKMHKDYMKHTGATEETTKHIQGQPNDQWLVPRSKWAAEFEDDGIDDDDDDIPPVPIKTKDAYRLPKGTHLNNSQTINVMSDPGSAGSRGMAPALSLSKAINKLHSNLISKLALKNERDSDSSSVGSGSGTPPSNRKMANKSTTGLGFPHRLDKKPKGPRDPPPNWKVPV